MLERCVYVCVDEQLDGPRAEQELRWSGPAIADTICMLSSIR